jgi:hypothetical protein
MKNVDEALETHLKEWFEYLSQPVHAVDAKGRSQNAGVEPRVMTEPTIPVLDEEIFQQFFPGEDRSILDAPRRRRQGRPFTLDMNESFQAFLFVYRQQGVFKKRNDVERVPEKVTDAFIDLAKDTWYPNAKKRRIRELLRMRKKYI